MEVFTPVPILIVETPEQIKAFTDPLRLRVLRMLCEDAATNQQLADALGEPHAKVLYHVRFLVEAGLIKLIDTQIKGGNVEKYYRAVARIFDLRPAPGDVETEQALIATVLDTLRQRMLTSLVEFPDSVAHFHNREAWLTPDQVEEFNDRLVALIGEYWNNPAPTRDPNAVRMRFNTFSYRDPG